MQLFLELAWGDIIAEIEPSLEDFGDGVQSQNIWLLVVAMYVNLYVLKGTDVPSTQRRCSHPYYLHQLSTV